MTDPTPAGPPKPPIRKVIAVRMFETGIAAIDAAAKELGMDRSEFVRQACLEKITRHKVEKSKNAPRNIPQQRNRSA